MNKKPYSSAIKKTPYKYPIAKKIAGLMLDGLDYDEVFKKSFNDNYIEIESEQASFTSGISKRYAGSGSR